MERLCGALTLLVALGALLVLILILLVVALVLDAIARRLGLGLVALLLHAARRAGDVQAHLAHFVGHGAQPLLPRDGVLGSVGGRGGQRGTELEGDFGFVNRGVLDEVQGEGEGGLAGDEEREVVGCGTRRGLVWTRLSGVTANGPCTSATPQFQPRTLTSLVSREML